MSFTETPAHTEIFRAIKDGRSHVQISAVAGSGKTSTIVESLKQLETLDPIPSTRFVAFNKRIVEELVARVPSWCSVVTLNAMGHQALVAHLRGMGINPRLDSDKTRKLTRENLTDAAFRSYGSQVIKLVALAKSNGMFPVLPGFGFCEPLLDDEDGNWAALADRYDVEIPEKVEPSDVFDAASSILRLGCQQLNVIDFDDQLLLTYAFNAPLQRFKRLFVDEAQDLSRLQHVLVERSIDIGGCLVAVGDPHQAIYGFRGADSSSMARMRDHFEMLELPLHVSYRCPQSVVELAQKYVPHIQPHKSAPLGETSIVPLGLDKVGARAGDMVVCRFNAPVVRAAYSLLKQGIPCVVLGRDIGKGLQSLLKKLNPTSIDDLTEKVEEWRTKEKNKAAARDNVAKQEAIDDKADSLLVFAAMCENVGELDQRIESMFSDQGADEVVTCCTIHKSKGLEAKNVFIVDFHKMPSKYATQPWQKEQERNLIYVAVTRAKSRLQAVLVNENVEPIKGPSPNASRQPVTRAALVPVEGRTYPVKDRLKAMGATWDPIMKTWLIEEDKLQEAKLIVRRGY